MQTAPAPGPDLVRRVRAGFVMKGTTMHRWCREQGIAVQNVRQTLTGAWNGPKGRKLRALVIKAAGVEGIAA